MQIASDEEGALFVAYRLYDSRGGLVAESSGFEEVDGGLNVRSSSGELLLDVPANSTKHLRYRLYNSSGQLLTTSDGRRTKIYGILRMEGGDNRSMHTS